MSDHFQISILEHRINELRAEIKTLIAGEVKGTPEQYLQSKKKRDFLNNLLVIARNELRSLLHHYRISVTGIPVNRRNLQQQSKRIVDVYSQICLSKNTPVNLSVVAINDELLKDIRNEVAGLFADQKFQIQRIRQLK